VYLRGPNYTASFLAAPSPSTQGRAVEPSIKKWGIASQVNLQRLRPVFGMHCWQQLARQGDSQGCSPAGLRYESGGGVHNNSVSAVHPCFRSWHDGPGGGTAIGCEHMRFHYNDGWRAVAIRGTDPILGARQTYQEKVSCTLGDQTCLRDG